MGPNPEVEVRLSVSFKDISPQPPQLSGPSELELSSTPPAMSSDPLSANGDLYISK